jgi:hypothetical protein
MQTRTRDWLKALEAKIDRKVRAFVFIRFADGEPDALSREEQLSAFKAEHSIAPSDPIHEATVTFA